MHLHRTGMRALAGVCALTMLLAACGDDEDSADTSDDTEQTTTEAADETTESTVAEDETTASEPEDETTTSEAEDGDPEAVAVAEAINIKLEDLAEGWVEEESDDSEEDNFSECFTTVDVVATTVGEAETPNFSVETPDGQGGQAITMQTVVFDSPETATAVLAEVATPEFAACTQESLTSETVEGTTAALTPVVDDPPVAEESVGLAGVVEIPADDGSTQQGSVDLHAIRTGAVASFTFTLDIGETPDSAFQQTLAELYSLIADRQAAEAG
jgi:hypothetical protein